MHPVLRGIWTLRQALVHPALDHLGGLKGRVALFHLVDWIDTQPDIVKKARELDDCLNEVGQTIWEFMKDTTSEIPDLEIPTRTNSILASVAGLFRSSSDDHS